MNNATEQYCIYQNTIDVFNEEDLKEMSLIKKDIEMSKYFKDATGQDVDIINIDYISKYRSKIVNGLKDYVNNYILKNRIKIQTIEKIQFLKIVDKNIFNIVEQNINNERKISFIYIIKQDQEANMSFNNFKFKIDLKQNMLIIFPANFAYAYDFNCKGSILIAQGNLR